MKRYLADQLSMIWENLTDRRGRWGQVWRLLVCPVTAPLLFGGMFLVGLSQLIAHGKWRVD